MREVPMDLHKAIVNTNEVDWMELAHGERIAFRRKLLGQAAGAEKLGCSLFEVAPGKRAWPFHYHFANEEALYILAGCGTLRLGAEEFTVGVGHFVSFRSGPETAHQLINTGSEPLRYLCFSTMHGPEVCGYPDSGKLGIIAGRAPGGSGRVSAMRKCFREASEVDYYEGE
jgi:uncharacterized cupin superfamily protein